MYKLKHRSLKKKLVSKIKGFTTLNVILKLSIGLLA